jgi:hypothetical protein
MISYLIPRAYDFWYKNVAYVSDVIVIEFDCGRWVFNADMRPMFQ